MYNCDLAKNEAKQCDTYKNRVTHGINKTVNNTVEENLYTVCANEVRKGRYGNKVEIQGCKGAK